MSSSSSSSSAAALGHTSSRAGDDDRAGDPLRAFTEMGYSEYERFLSDFRLVDEGFTRREASLCFVWRGALVECVPCSCSLSLVVQCSPSFQPLPSLC